MIIAGAGGAAHLPGMVAAKTLVPVLGVPVPATVLNGVDALLSIVQMPKGVPVGTLAIGKPGAANAALLAAAIVATGTPRCASACAPGATARRDEVLGEQTAVSDDPPWRDDRHPRRRPARPDDGDGRALARLPRARARPRPDCAARFVVEPRRRRARSTTRTPPPSSPRGAPSSRSRSSRSRCGALARSRALAPVRPAPSVPCASCRTARGRRSGSPARVSRRCRTATVRHRRRASRRARELGRCFVKSTSGGYDGRGQVRVATADEAAPRGQSLGGAPCGRRAGARARGRALGAGGAPPAGRVTVRSYSAGAQPPRAAASSTGPCCRRPLPARVRARAIDSRATSPTRSASRGCSRSSCSSRGRRAARQRARAAAAQHVPLHRGGVRDQPVRAARARGVRSAARRTGARAPGGDRRTCSATCGATATPAVRRGAGAPGGARCTSTASASARPGRKMGHLSAIGADRRRGNGSRAPARETQCGGSDAPTRCVRHRLVRRQPRSPETVAAPASIS